jgi:hypothetical protein
MKLYENLEQILPYLISIRKLDKFLSIDVSFPEKWKLIKKFVDKETVAEQKQISEGYRTFSFFCELNDLSMESQFDNIKGLIQYNKENEAKELLLVQKKNELDTFFSKYPISDLYNLTFDIKKDTTKINNEQITETTELAEQ